MLHAADSTPQRFDPDARVVKTVIRTYFSRGVAAADRARDRAERGYTIAGAVAATLVAAGLAANLSQRPPLVQALGLGAVGVWLVAVLLFIWTVAVDVSAPDTEGLNAAGWTTGSDFVRSVGQDVQRELDALHARQVAALTATVIAMALTIAALVAGTVDPSRSTRESARVALTAQADSALRLLCGRAIGALYATVEPGDLSTAVVSLELPAGECGDTATTIREPRTAIIMERKLGRVP
jgi:hypothetical protein